MAEESASCTASVWAVLLRQIGRTDYRSTYRPDG
jgi:hypothetical protein